MCKRRKDGHLFQLKCCVPFISNCSPNLRTASTTWLVGWFGCAGSSLLLRLLSSCGEQGLLSSRGVQASRCGGFSCAARALGHAGFSSCSHGLSSCGAQGLGHKLSTCGIRAQLLCGMWDLSRPGIKPVFPASAGGFFTTVPPGKPLNFYVFFKKRRKRKENHEVTHTLYSVFICFH